MTFELYTVIKSVFLSESEFWRFLLYHLSGHRKIYFYNLTLQETQQKHTVEVIKNLQ